MSNAWIALGVLPVVAAVLRELVALRRYRVRRASIESVVGRLGPGSRVVDRDPGGAVIEVTVDRVRDEPAA
ncbi:hypothetical protein ACWGE0_21605 [Lentzea sp. NPDC054927]